LEDELFREFVDSTVLSLRVSFVEPLAVISELASVIGLHRQFAR
jgi:hypothetical protein